jgi:hypothetical protein
LIQLANTQGGKDNVTAILLQMLASSSGSKKNPEKKKYALTTVVPVGLILVILSFISFIWQSSNKNTERMAKTIILPQQVDSIPRELNPHESKRKKPSEVRARTKVIDNASAKIKDSLPSTSSTEAHDPDSLEYIESRVKDLHLLMHKWDSVKKVIDSLQKNSRKLDGKEMLRLGMLTDEFERFVAKQHFQRLFNEWNNFQNHPDTIVLGQGFIIAGLDRKVEEGNKILFKVDESLKNVKSKKERE